MNALTVLSVAALAASTGGYFHHGLLGAYNGYNGLLPYAYPGVLPASAPLAFNTPLVKNVAPAPVTYNVAPVAPVAAVAPVAPAPVTYNVAPVAPVAAVAPVAPAPVTYNVAPVAAVAPVAPAPVTYNVAPVAAVAPVAPAPVTYNVAPVAPIQSQYHAQDEIGQYSFGYAGGPSSRAETRDAFGIVRGSYNYIDSEGKLQTQHYVADALGFRVSGTNLPVAPEAPEAATLALPGPLPEPVQDTPEVAAAKVAHQQAFDEAAAAAAAAPDSRKKRSVLAAPALGVSSPLRFSYGFSTPLHYAHAPAFSSPLVYGAAHPALTTYTAAQAPATYATHVPATYAAHTGAALRDAELLRVVHNPSHATSYRVLN